MSFDPSNYATRLKKADILIEESKKDDAIYELILTGHLSIGADKLWQAVKAFRKALTLDREKTQCYYELGKLYEKLGKKKEAVASYKKHAQKNVKFSNFGEALNSCEAILKIDSRYEWAKKAREKIMATIPKIQEAFQNN